MRRLRPLVALVVMGLAVFLAFRVFLFVERRADLADLTGADLVAMRVRGLCLPLLLLAALVPGRRIAGYERLASIYAALVLLLVAGGEVAGVHFFRYYDFRFNYLVVDHAASPEVAGTILSAYPLGTIALLVLGLGALAYLVWRRVAGLSAAAAERPPRTGRTAAVLALPLLVLMIRGSLDHRPINPSLAVFGDNRVANEITGNGLGNVIYDLLQRRKGSYQTLADHLALLDDERALGLARAALADTGTWLDDAPSPLAREVGADRPAGPTNIMVVVLESYTAGLVGHLGGRPALTPRLDALAAESLVLGNCYATGERTIQGLEALLSSFPPLPGVGVVRRPEAAGGFDTLASVVKPRGYATRFLYGGQGLFDHMSAFFLNNGYDEFIEEADIDGEVFQGEWGWCDQDVLARADAEMRALHAAGTPFLVTVLTVSLHSPWEYPAGVIEPLPRDVAVPAGFEYEELNTFRYVDEAIGRFMERVKAAPYYDDTVFAFVGDHGVHLRGRELIPADEYRVAALIHAPGFVAPGRIDGVTSQLDIAPTLLSIVGGPWRSTFFGGDLLTRDADDEGRALMVYNKRRFATLNGPRLTVLPGEGEDPKAFMRTAEQEGWRVTPVDAVHAADAQQGTSLLQVSEQMLEQGRYRSVRERP